MRIFQCEKAHNFLQTLPKEGILVTVLTIHMKKGKLIFLGMKDVPTRRRKYVDTIAMLCPIHLSRQNDFCPGQNQNCLRQNIFCPEQKILYRDKKYIISDELYEK